MQRTHEDIGGGVKIALGVAAHQLPILGEGDLAGRMASDAKPGR